jgi:iron transport multicopper oxidase
MSIVAVDGQAVEPTNTQSITIGPGQRYDVVITAKTTDNQNYGIYSRLVESPLLSNTGTLKYTDSSVLPIAKIPSVLPSTSINDMDLKPTDNQLLLEPVTETIEMDVHYIDTDDGPRYVI